MPPRRRSGWRTPTSRESSIATSSQPTSCLTDDRRIKILDLGLGVLMEADSAATFATADGIAVGTVDYMSPEQACGREVDGRSDLYGLGCSMYHLMSGKLPFPGSSPIERLGKRIGGRHTPITEYLPDIPASFVRVLDKMLAHKPHERYATAAEAAEALQSLIRPKAKAADPGATGSPHRSTVLGRCSPAEAKPVPDPKAPPGPIVRQGPAQLPSMVRAGRPDLSSGSPRAALAWVVITLAATFAAGIGARHVAFK